ncbi:MATE family efflux transporter [Caulobacter sp. 17J65-9]|uniref:MATE family efflux transporter n=1 Tax=Caulobacter sp. 17J65-9 TaxID=2709382 RepID=UPI0013CCA21D|nr:MATE family efflux transporter [Caulobacter sp. 17J65-9]NEX92208.1 MATE family efflux transporter [Caulobacter sp. 17J65-9]
MTSTAHIARRTPRLRLPDGTGELLRLAWPVVLARLGIMTMGLTDAIVVGRHSAEQLGFHALGWAPTSVMLTTAVGVLLGVQVMTARRIGEGRRDLTGAVLRRGLVYGAWLGVAAMLALALLGPVFLHHAGLDPALADGATGPLRVFSLSLFPYLISVVCTYFLEALGRPKPGMVAMWVANGVNLAANLWLVPGTSGLPVEGAVASAWATFIARTVLAVWLLVFIARLPEARDLGIFKKPTDGPEVAREQRKIGYGAGASYFIEVGAFAGMTIIAGQFGGVEVAAWTIVLNISAIIFMGPMGLAAATGVLVSRAYGARDRHGVVRSGLIGFGVTVVLTLLICAIVWPGASLIAGSYTRDPALLAVAVPALVLACLFFVADGLQVVAAQALRARADVWLPTAFHLTSYGLIMLPLGWLFAHPLGLGVDGMVWAVIVASLVSAALLCGRFLLLARREL